MSPLCDKDLFLETPVKDLAARSNAASARQGLTGAAVSLPGSPPSSEAEVRMVHGLDKGGNPEAVHIVAAMINQAHANSPGSTILVENFPCDDDRYVELAVVLGTYLPQLDALLTDCVMFRGTCRPAHVMLGCNFAGNAVCLATMVPPLRNLVWKTSAPAGRVSSRRCMMLAMGRHTTNLAA